MFQVWRNFEQGKESARKKKKASSKKQRRVSEDEQPQENASSRHDASPHQGDAEDRTSPISHLSDRADSHRKDRHELDDSQRLTGPLPPVSPQNSSHNNRNLDGDRPRESYRRLSESEDGSRLSDRHLPDKPNGSAFPGPLSSSAGKLAPIGQLEPLNTG